MIAKMNDNNHIQRYYSSQISDLLEPNRALVIYGPRRAGKTTLIKRFLANYPHRYLLTNGDDAQLRKVLESQEFSKIIPFFQGYDLVVIDEAQKVNQIGQALKIMVDQIEGIKVIATGSSSFELANQVGEPLVGRKRTIKLFPVSALELKQNYGPFRISQNLENLLIYGSYPKVLSAEDFKQKADYLEQIRDSYLYKDILQLEQIKHSKKILNLLELVAFQIGQEVSLQELGVQLEMSKNTVARYLDLLEKSFVLINVRGFSRNLRKEISKTSRYYFYDNGVRNALINNFNWLNQRDDVGQLWENFLFIERLKFRHYTKLRTNQFFWRTWDQQEVDLVEERGGKLFGYEFKWGKKQPQAPQSWQDTYPNSSYQVINQDNYLQFIVSQLKT